MEGIKKERIETLNQQFEERKKQVMFNNKDKQIQEASQKLMSQNNINSSRIAKTPSSAKSLRVVPTASSLVQHEPLKHQESESVNEMMSPIVQHEEPKQADLTFTEQLYSPPSIHQESPDIMLESESPSQKKDITIENVEEQHRPITNLKKRLEIQVSIEDDEEDER